MLEKPIKLNRVTRRTVLKGAFEAGGVLAATTLINPHPVYETQRPQPNPAVAKEDAGVEITSLLNVAATIEALTARLYQNVLAGAAFFMDVDDVEHLRQMRDAEVHHQTVWQSLGGFPLTDKFHMPARLLVDASTFINTGLLLEATSVGLYLAATHQFAVLGQPRLAAVAAQHAASEAQHHTLLSRLAGLKPNHVTLPLAFTQGSEVMPALWPFLDREDSAAD